MAAAVDLTVTSATPVTLAISGILGIALDLGMRDKMRMIAEAMESGLFPSQGRVPPPRCLYQQTGMRGLYLLTKAAASLIRLLFYCQSDIGKLPRESIPVDSELKSSDLIEYEECLEHCASGYSILKRQTR